MLTSYCPQIIFLHYSLVIPMIIDQIDQESDEVDETTSEKTSKIEVNYHYGEHLGYMSTDDMWEIT